MFIKLGFFSSKPYHECNVYIPILGKTVYGVLWTVAERDSLDKREGHPDLYHRVMLPVYLPNLNTVVEAFSYVVNNHLVSSEYVPPHSSYVSLIREGLRYGVPEFYYEENGLVVPS